jgi:superfamily II DNA or RNA helicase
VEEPDLEGCLAGCVVVVKVLVGTNVLSEGIDLPDCGLVVVLDPIQHPRQLAQMRGTI